MLMAVLSCTHARHHSLRGMGVSACSQDFSAPRAVPQKGTRSQSFASSTSPHRGISRSSTCLLRLHHLEMVRCSILPWDLTRARYLPAPPLPLAGQPVLGPGPPSPVGQDTVCKRHIHVANHIGVRLLVKGFVSDPSPQAQTERERRVDRQAEG